MNFASGSNFNFKNNVVYSAVTNTNHAAIATSSTSSLPGTFDYNDIYVTGGTKLAMRSSTPYAALSNWQGSSGSPDANSVSVDPYFASSTDLTSSNCALKNKGTNLSISPDIDGTARDATPDIGAKELSLAFSTGRWTGATSTAWATATNWCDGTLPTSATDVTIPNGAANMPTHSTGTGAARNLTIATGATLTLSGGTLAVHESLTKNGTLTQSGGTIDFAGTGSQQNVPSGTYTNLKVSGGGDKILLGDVTVNNSLDVSDGFIETGIYAVTLGASATLTETATDYIKGIVKTTRTISSTGTAENFGGLGLTITAGNAGRLPGSTQVTRYTDRQLGSSYLQNGVPRIGMTRAFDIVPATNGGLNATLAFHYSDDDLNTIDEQHLYFYRAPHSAGTTFHHQGRSSLDQTNNVMTLTGIDSFSVWTGGGTNGGLPVTLVSFEARWENAQAALAWQTASEENNDYFGVERSLDGIRWEEIGRVAGAGTTQSLRVYGYRDGEAASLLSPVLYYRLRQTDYNGQFAYSDIRTLRRTGHLTDGRLRAAYDASAEALRATLTAREGRSLAFHLTDGLGRVVTTGIVPAGKGEVRVALSMQSLPKGFYTLRLETGETVKVMKN